MILECPHCHMIVLALAGECPSCRKRVDDLSGTDPTRTALRIREGTQLPARCALCDAPATRAVSVRRVARSGMPLEAGVLVGVLTFLFAFALLALPVAKGVHEGWTQGLLAFIVYLPCVLLGLLLCFLFIFGGFMWPVLVALAAVHAVPARLRSRRPVRVLVPLCGRCRRSALDPIAVDTEACAMTFLVDRRFAERAAAGAASGAA
jgi:hypothetical protein